MKNESARMNLPSILTVILVITLFSAGLVSAFFHSGSSPERHSNAGEVKISARYLAHESELKDETTFRINLSSEKDDVTRYDLKELSFVKVNGGPDISAADWESTGDEQHIQGNLRFTGHNLHESRLVQLIIKGIGTSDDRVFEWKATDD